MEEKLNYKKLTSLKHYFTSKKPAPSGLIIEFGSRGSGKSAKIAKKLYQWEKQKRSKKGSPYQNFYSNISFNIDDPNVHYLNLSQFKFTDYIENNEITQKYQCFTIPKKGPDTDFKIKPNSIICLDELGILFHSRNYKAFPEEIINFVKILRKLGILFIYRQFSAI